MPTHLLVTAVFTIAGLMYQAPTGVETEPLITAVEMQKAAKCSTLTVAAVTVTAANDPGLGNVVSTKIAARSGKETIVRAALTIVRFDYRLLGRAMMLSPADVAGLQLHVPELENGGRYRVAISGRIEPSNGNGRSFVCADEVQF